MIPPLQSNAGVVLVAVKVVLVVGTEKEEVATLSLSVLVYRRLIFVSIGKVDEYFMRPTR